MRRWGSQWELVQRHDDPCDADVARLHSALAEAIPAQSRTSIVHGDYRIDNTILDSTTPPSVLAVLDWEMSTLGDPLSDAALMCVYRHPMFDLVHATRRGRRRCCRRATIWRTAIRWSPGSRWTTGSSTWRWRTSSWRSSRPASTTAPGWAESDDPDKIGDAVAPLIAAGVSSLKAS